MLNINPCLLEPFFVTRLPKGGVVTTPRELEIDMPKV